MESAISQAFQEELICFICSSYFTDPVTINCGHSFCRACLHLSWEDIKVLVHCPICWEPSQQKDLRTNIVLKKLVTIAVYEHCLLNIDIHYSLQEKLLKKMASLWEKIDENQKNLEAEDSMITQFREHLTQREDMIRTEYQKWNPGFDDFLQWSEPMQLSMPQAMKPELSALPIIGLTEHFQSFQAPGQVFFPEQNAITWKTTLLNYMRRISFRPHLQGPSVDIPGCYTVFCGSKCYISGKYYWEVVVKDSLDWVVGVCTDSSFRKENLCVGCMLLLLACVKEGNHCNLLTSWPVIHLYIQKPVDRVGVLLDCDDGSLSFLDVARSSLIYKFPSGTINFPVQPFFCTDKTI
ncbi:tripartite motif-containing protein 43-like [Cricetulus griseus]|uniref:tripartite motif-containing protein 43-like n=1 Tax=Cricetulus griseus TaxID=10029 RepID=UPI0015C3E94A|nr:tripartite motif-containing protein 43-like [Cricetulus griseus]